MDPVERYLERLVATLGQRLGDELVSVILIGGAGAGAFEPASSDIDVVVVVERASTRERWAGLGAELSHRRRSVPARRLELVVYTRAGLHDARFELNLNTGTDVEQVGTDPDAEDAFWFLLDLAIARGRSRSLVGPPLAELAPEPSRERQARAALAGLVWATDHEPSAPDTLLNALRSWRWAEEGEWSTKDEAAAWARTRLPDPGPLDDALALRMAGRRDGVDPMSLRSIAGTARQALERAASASG